MTPTQTYYYAIILTICSLITKKKSRMTFYAMFEENVRTYTADIIYAQYFCGDIVLILYMHKC